MKDFETVGEYLDQAKLCLGIKTDASLAALLEVSRHSIAAYRKETQFPSPPLMIKIANLALMEPEQALVMREIRSASTEQEKIVWGRLKKKLRTRFLSLLVLLTPISYTSFEPHYIPKAAAFSLCSNINCAAFILGSNDKDRTSHQADFSAAQTLARQLLISFAAVFRRL